MAKNNEIDMLHGPLVGKILMFAIPFAFSSILQQLFNTMDVAIVGRFASSEALAAVGANTALINLIINLFVGCSIGANVVIANLIGHRDNDRIKQAVNTTSVLAVISGIILLFIGLIVSRPVLELMGTPESIIHDAILYLRIYFLGIPFFMIYNFGTSILRSRGDTKRPLYILIIAGIINVILNLIFVIVFHLGVAGVAIATDIANLYCATRVIWILLHEEEPFKVDPNKLKIDPIALKRILQIGLPAGLQAMVFSFSNVFIQATINDYGSAAIAGSSISQMFEGYCYFLMSAFCGAAVTFTGQNYGARQIERCKKIFWICLAFGALACFAANMMFLTCSDFFLQFFTTDPEVAHFTKIRILWVIAFQAIAASYEIPASAMRGLGHSLEPALLTIIGTCVLRLVWIFTICPIWPGYDRLMICYPASWILTGIMVSTVYVLTAKKSYAFIRKNQK